MYGWNWSVAKEATSNTFQVYPSTTPPTDTKEGVRMPELGQPYCEFAFLPEGWVLRVAESKVLGFTVVDN